MGLTVEEIDKYIRYCTNAEEGQDLGELLPVRIARQLLTYMKEHEKLYYALSALVDLKHYKNVQGKDDIYTTQMPLVWFEAEKVLNTLKSKYPRLYVWGPISTTTFNPETGELVHTEQHPPQSPDTTDKLQSIADRLKSPDAGSE